MLSMCRILVSHAYRSNVSLIVVDNYLQLSVHSCYVETLKKK